MLRLLGGHSEIVKVLAETMPQGLSRIAYVNMKNSPTQGSSTALHVAAKKRYLDVIETLISEGADAKLPDRFGRTALHSVAYNGATKIARRLIESIPEGPDRVAYVNATDSSNFRALDRAVNSYDSNSQMIKILMDFGADPCVEPNRLVIEQTTDDSRNWVLIEPAPRLIAPGVGEVLIEEMRRRFIVAEDSIRFIWLSTVVTASFVHNWMPRPRTDARPQSSGVGSDSLVLEVSGAASGSSMVSVVYASGVVLSGAGTSSEALLDSALQDTFEDRFGLD